MNRAPSWELFATFSAVRELGSLSAAARALNISQPTARRHIEELERALDVKLFSRSQTGLKPTAAALAIAPYADSLGSTVDALVRAAAASLSGISGPVRITASEIMGVHVLPGLLAPLLRDHPELSVEMAASNREDDLLNREADIAVRMVRPRQSAIIARKVGEVAVGLFAAPAYLAVRPPVTRDHLDEHHWVGQDRLTYFDTALIAAGIDPSATRFSFRSDSDSAQLGAVAAALGIGACHDTELAVRLGLERVLPEHEIRLELWLACHADLREQPRIRAVIDHLAKCLPIYARKPESS